MAVMIHHWLLAVDITMQYPDHRKFGRQAMDVTFMHLLLTKPFFGTKFPMY
jgi:hypothetical protein